MSNAMRRARLLLLASAQAEQLRRKQEAEAERAREDFYFFQRLMFMARKNFSWVPAEHHPKLADALGRVFRGELQNLIINIPPRYSKTEFAEGFIGYGLGHYPDSEFIYCSYSASLASDNTAAILEMVQNETYQRIFPDVQVSGDTAAKHKWRTTRGGKVYATGTKGTLTGYGAGKERPGFGGAIIIDDPHKASEARSDTVRQGVIDWFKTTLLSRRNSKTTPIIVIMQRLHESDLAGWLQNEGDGQEWEVLSLDAIQDEGLPTERALWPHKHTLEQLRKMEEALPYTFSGQYRQRPMAEGGNLFKVNKVNVIPAVPQGTRWIRGWDFGASVPEPGKDPDYTAGVRLGKTPEGRFVIAHALRDRCGPEDVEKMLKNTARMDGRGVKIDLPQDPGQAGKSQVLSFTKLLAGYSVVSSPESGDKITRAEPLAAQVNVGNVDIVEGEWNQAYLDEMRMFPSGKHDDQVDASSRAFNRLVEGRGKLKITEDLLRRA